MIGKKGEALTLEKLGKIVLALIVLYVLFYALKKIILAKDIFFGLFN